MIVSLVNFRVEPHRIPAFEEWFEPLVERTRRHSGCLRFDHLVSAADPCSRTLIEVWADSAAHRAHLAHDDLLEMTDLGSTRYGMHDLVVWKWTDVAPPVESRRPSTTR